MSHESEVHHLGWWVGGRCAFLALKCFVLLRKHRTGDNIRSFCFKSAWFPQSMCYQKFMNFQWFPLRKLLKQHFRCALLIFVQKGDLLTLLWSKCTLKCIYVYRHRKKKQFNKFGYETASISLFYQPSQSLDETQLLWYSEECIVGSSKRLLVKTCCDKCLDPILALGMLPRGVKHKI